MNSRQYEKLMITHLNSVLLEHNIKHGEYSSICLSADRTKYEIIMLDKTTKIISSDLGYDK